MLDHQDPEEGLMMKSSVYGNLQSQNLLAASRMKRKLSLLLLIGIVTLAPLAQIYLYGPCSSTSPLHCLMLANVIERSLDVYTFYAMI